MGPNMGATNGAYYVGEKSSGDEHQHRGHDGRPAFHVDTQQDCLGVRILVVLVLTVRRLDGDALLGWRSKCKGAAAIAVA